MERKKKEVSAWQRGRAKTSKGKPEKERVGEMRVKKSKTQAHGG